MMNLREHNLIKIAVIDMYEGKANQGMRCIRELLNQFADINGLNLQIEEFEVRINKQVPDLSYDMYISSGGPGSPLDSEGSEWENKYFDWLQSVVKHNEADSNIIKKQVFFICHSFQLACRYFKIATVSKRKSTAFGVFPMHYLANAENEPVFEGLRDPFHAVDSRDYQVTQPVKNKMEEIGAHILAIEKERPHVPYERAIMAIRFNENMVGTQFHPEADAVGMLLHLHTPERKKIVIDNYGAEKWQAMIVHLDDPDKIMHTYSHIMPNFLNASIAKLSIQFPHLITGKEKAEV